MKKAMMILFLLLLSMPAMAAETPPVQVRDGTNTADLRLLMNSFAALGDGHVENVLRGLKILSVTEEARSGEWQKMRGMLAEFERGGIKAAAVWFLRPDGSYYTVGTGLTDQNLRDRAYFPRLMAGEEIAGDLVISKATGKRTAIVAVPVRENGRVVGALGTSLDVDEISRTLDQEMGLPENMLFYAIDQKGQTSLHRKSALLFAYPSDMGSKSLAKTVAEMLSRPEGEVTYDFYGERTVVFKKSPLTGWVFVIGIVTGRPGEPRADLPPALSAFEKDITAELNKADQDLAGLAAKLSGKDLATEEARKMLGDLCRSHPYAADCSIVDSSGKMVMVEPHAYARFEGSDISMQEQAIRLRQTNKPVLSNAFKSVEGFDAVDLAHPILSSGGEFAGSVSMLIRPESVFSYVLTPVLQGMPVEAFVMQTDGRILYDQDKEDVGRMLFDDPMYKPFPQLIAVGTMASREKTGAGSYDFRQAGSEKMVKKDAYWTTVGLHGTEWRLIVMHVRTGHAVASGKDFSHADALRALAENAKLKKACSGSDDATIREIFRKFYSEHPGLYSVQWLDILGTNRYGYPEENSLINFDMKTLRTDSAGQILRALSDKKESTFDSPLVEGKTGAFFMVPVYEGGEYLGMIYTVRLKE